MSIASAITSLQSRVADAYTSVGNKGGTIPQTQDTLHLPAAIASIPAGSSSKFGATIEQVFDTVTEDDVTTLNMYGGVTSLTFTGVTNIPEYGLYYKFYKSSVTSVSFPDLTSITNNKSGFNSAFQDCTSLTSVSFAELTSITSTSTGSSSETFTNAFVDAFKGCTSLTSVSFPKLATVSNGDSAYVYGIFNSAFDGCTSLTSVSFPELTSVNGCGVFSYAFNGCTALTTVSFTKLATVTNERVSNTTGPFSHAFSGCTSLTSVSFPALTTIYGVDSFGYAFQGCTSLTSISFPELASITLTYTGITSRTGSFSYAFSGCTNLTSVSFPKLASITAVANSGTPFKTAFNGTGVTSLSFPALTTIIENATSATYAVFQGNTTLTRMDFPVLTSMKKTDSATSNNLTYIFSGCTNLAELHFGADNQSVIEASDGYATKWGAPSGCTIYFDL